MISLDLLLSDRNRWGLWSPVGIAFGIVLYFSLFSEPALWWLAATPIALLGWGVARRWFFPKILFQIIVLIAAGFNAGQLQTMFVTAPMIQREIGPAPVTGRLMLAEKMPDGVRLTLANPEIDRLPPDRMPQAVRIRIKDVDYGSLPPAGARITLMAQLAPFSEPVMPDAFDFRRYSFFKGLGGTGWARLSEKHGIEVVEQNQPLNYWDRVEVLFERARRVITAEVYRVLSGDGQGDSAAMVASLLNGQQSSISKEVIQNMRISGLAHILSISGLHVSMMGLLIYYPLRALLAMIPFLALRFPIKKWAAAGAITATMTYVMLVGAEAPTLRSALATGLIMFAILVDRRTQSMRLLSLCASLVLLVQPYGLMGPSFQMSFAAVLAMVAYYEKDLDQSLAKSSWLDLPAWLHFFRQHAGAIIMTSLLATAATTPFTIYHFQNFSIYGVVANMLGVPVTSLIIMPCLLMTYLMMPFGLAAPFITAAGWGTECLMAISRTVGAWPLAQIHVPAMPDWALLLIMMGLLWLCLMRHRLRYMGCVLILLGALYPLVTSQPSLLVLDDGRQWAARLADGRWAVADLDRESFAVTQWRQRLGFPEMVEATSAPTDSGLVCDVSGCIYKKSGRLVALPNTPLVLPEDCRMANVVISPAMIRNCAAPHVIDDHALWQGGAHEVTIADDGGIGIASVRPRRALRPWSPGWRGQE